MVRTAATATTQSSTEEKQPTTPVLYASNEVVRYKEKFITLRHDMKLRKQN